MPTNAKERSLTFTVGLFVMIRKKNTQKQNSKHKPNRNKQNLRKRADVAAIVEGVIGAALSFVLSLSRLTKKGQEETGLTPPPPPKKSLPL